MGRKATIQDFDRETIEEVFAYLDDLRESGVTNMFGATPYIERAFGFERHEATALWSAWMKSDLSLPVQERATVALASAA